MLKTRKQRALEKPRHHKDKAATPWKGRTASARVDVLEKVLLKSRRVRRPIPTLKDLAFKDITIDYAELEGRILCQ